MSHLNKTLTSPALCDEAERPRPRHGLMHILMLMATACWAANIVAVKEALHGFAPLALVQLRVTGAAVVLFAIFRAWPRRPALRIPRAHWGTMAVLALTGVTFNQLFFIGGVARTSVAHTGLLVALGPVIVLVLACLLGLEALTILKFIGMLVSFAGVAVLTMGHVGRGNPSYWLGDMIVLAGTAVFAVYTIQLKKVSHLYDALTFNTLIYCIGALLLIPLGARPLLASHWAAITPRVAWAAAYTIVFGSVVPYTIYAYAMTELAASRVAAFSYLQPVMATGLGIWLLGERLSTSVVFGGALILVGVYLTERERGEENGKNAAPTAVRHPDKMSP
jgi:drug/metabolite transporter (DMT)-like permease